MNRYQVETGGLRAQQVAKTHEDAVVAVFKRRPPKQPSLLTRVKRLTPGVGRGVWYYIASDVMLRRAGYKVRS
jgi:hypothetical protein